MIEEFSFGNYWSFKEIQTLNLTASRIKSKDSEIDHKNVIPIHKNLSLLKSKAIYGANASGKSNIIRAFVTFIRIIRDSVKDDKVIRLIDSFRLSTETEHEPSFFQLVFRIGNIRYRYGFEADDKSIKSEWLFSTPKIREQALFIREEGRVIELNHTHFEEGLLYQKLFKNSKDPIFTNTSLFLTHLSSTGFGNISKQVLRAISSITVISGLGHKGMYGIAGDSLTDSVKKKFILDFLSKADTGIDDINAVELANDFLPEGFDIDADDELRNRKIIVSSRKKYNANLVNEGTAEFSFSLQESEGTKKMFEISPFVYRSLKDGTPLIIDEFDSRFHPLLTKRIVELFNSYENNSAQFVFTTHDTNLLTSELLRRDQIEFVEKDKFGSSHLYSLAEISGIRNDASFEKDYMHGKYGAVPYLVDFTQLIPSD